MTLLTPALVVDVSQVALVLSPHGWSVLVPVSSCRCCSCGDSCASGRAIPVRTLPGSLKERLSIFLGRTGLSGALVRADVSCVSSTRRSSFVSLVVGGSWGSVVLVLSWFWRATRQDVAIQDELEALWHGRYLFGHGSLRVAIGTPDEDVYTDLAESNAWEVARLLARHSPMRCVELLSDGFVKVTIESAAPSSRGSSPRELRRQSGYEKRWMLEPERRQAFGRMSEKVPSSVVSVWTPPGKHDPGLWFFAKARVMSSNTRPLRTSVTQSSVACFDLRMGQVVWVHVEPRPRTCQSEACEIWQQHWTWR